MKRIVIMGLCILCITIGFAIAFVMYNMEFNNEEKNYIQNINMDYIEKDGVQFKVDYLSMTETNLDIVLNFKMQEDTSKYEGISFSNILITDEEGKQILLDTEGEENYKNYTKVIGSKPIRNKKNTIRQLLFLTSDKFPNSKKLYISFDTIILYNVNRGNPITKEFKGDWRLELDVNGQTEDNANIEKVSEYNNPVIPKGFKKIETEMASWEIKDGVPKGWNNGLVIEDKIGNQFVWVPVKDTSFGDFQKEESFLLDTESTEEKQQIEEYGGFYIARYEAGVTSEMQNKKENISATTNDIQGIPVSKKNAIAWNFISLKNAKINATSMYDSEELRSNLITTRQWLYLMKWLSESNYNIKNPKEFGNFVDSYFKFTGYYSIDYGKSYSYAENKMKQTYNMILSTGATEKNMTNNIYDLAGNLMEYTDGYVPDRGYFSVGGHYDTTSDYGIEIARLLGVIPLEKIGFRIVLYFK